MPLEEENLNQNEGVRGLLNKNHKAELGKILAFGEKYKKEGEEMRKGFWRIGDKDKYVNLIMQYKDSKRLYMKNLTEEEKEILGKLNGVWRDKFIEEYMHDKILYSGNLDKYAEREMCYSYESCKAGKVIMKEGAGLNLRGHNIGGAGAKTISKMKMKGGVTLYLDKNNIGDAGAAAISKIKLEEGMILSLWDNDIGDAGAVAISKMKLKEGVQLDLSKNHIGNVGAEAISKMKLKEGVELDLGHNNIGDAGAYAIMKNFELKVGVRLYLVGNNMSKEMKDKLEKWAQRYINSGINCEVWL